MATKRIKILHATLHLKVGGLETVIMDLCRHHNRQLFQITVVCFNKYDPVYKKELEKLGINVFYLQRKGRFDFGFFIKLIKLFKSEAVDILHAHSGCIFNTVFCARFAKVSTVVVTEHGLPIFADGRPMPKSLKNKLENFLVGHLTDRFVAVSAEIEEHLLLTYSGPKKQVNRIINGIDCVKYAARGNSQKRPTDWGIPQGKTVIGSVGRLVPIKNYSCLLRSFAALYKENRDTHLVLIGDGPEREKLEACACTSGVAEAVTFLGVRNNIAEYLPWFDVFVLPSITEGTSISLLEAQACGVPAVVTAVGGNPDIVKNGVNGFVVEVNDENGIYEKIASIIGDTELHLRLASNARKIVLDRYEVKTMVENYENLYFELIEKKMKLSKKCFEINNK